ncbi:cytochrome b [Nocardia thailandica]
MSTTVNDDASRRFGPASMLLHWLSVPVVLLAFGFGVAAARGGGDYTWRMDVHQAAGTAVFALVVARAAARLWGRGPGPDAALGPLERRVATLTEILMYALLAAQPVVGWLAACAAGLPPRIGAVTVRAPVPVDPALYATLRDVHAVTGYSLVAVAAAHVLAVLFHAVIRRDGVLARMVPGR